MKKIEKNSLTIKKDNFFKTIINKIKVLFFIQDISEIDIEKENFIENNIEDLKSKLKNLEKEYKDLQILFNKKIETLESVRIKELKLTLQIYQLEEIFLKETLLNQKMKIKI